MIAARSSFAAAGFCRSGYQGFGSAGLPSSPAVGHSVAGSAAESEPAPFPNDGGMAALLAGLDADGLSMNRSGASPCGFGTGGGGRC